jgi:nitrogen PTS system EIIA component
MVTLCRLIGKQGICHLEETTKVEALRELVFRTPQFSKKPWRDCFLEAVFHNEEVQTTGFGKGVAVAHGTCDGIEQVQVSLGISRKGIAYHALDGKPVHLLFLVANPPETQPDYLSALSTLVRLLREEEFRSGILQCSTSAQVYELFRQLGCCIPIAV